jgi:hypothetical protein
MEGDPSRRADGPMRACAPVGLMLLAASASFPSGPGPFPEPEATPSIPLEQPSKEASKPSKRVKSARKPPQPQIVSFRERNRRSRIPPRRRSRKASGGNPRRLGLRRGGCLVAGRQHRHPDVFHAKIGPCADGHGTTERVLAGSHRMEVARVKITDAGRRAHSQVTVLAHYRSNDNDGLLDRRRKGN